MVLRYEQHDRYPRQPEAADRRIGEVRRQMDWLARGAPSVADRSIDPGTWSSSRAMACFAASAVLFILAVMGGLVSSWLCLLFFLAMLGAAGFGLVAFTKSSASERVRKFDTQWTAMHLELNALCRYIGQADAAFNLAEDQRLEAAPMWHPIGLPPGTDAIYTFGGGPRGREKLLATVLCSMLGQGRRIHVLDLSAERESSLLVEAGRAAGISVLEWKSTSGEHFDPLSSLSAEDVIEILSRTLKEDEVVHSESADRGTVLYVLSAVIRALDPDQSLTVERIVAAINLVLRPAQQMHWSAVVSNHEESELLMVLTDEQRQQPGLTQALTNLAGILGLLVEPTEPHHENQSLVDPTRAQLEAVQISTLSMQGKLLADLTVDSLVKRLAATRSDGIANVLVVVGADRLSEAVVDRVQQTCRAFSILPFLLCDYYRGVARAAAGRAGSLRLFLSLLDQEDAAAAAQQFGSRRDFFLAERTVNSSNSRGRSTTWTTGKSSGGWNSSTATADSDSFTEGGGQSYRAEVRQFIEPNVLTDLGTTQAYLLQRSDDRSVPVVPLDFEPTLAEHRQLGGNLRHALRSGA